MAPRQNSSHEKELKEVLHGGIHVQCFPCSGHPSSLTFSIYPTNYITARTRCRAKICRRCVTLQISFITRNELWRLWWRADVRFLRDVVRPCLQKFCKEQGFPWHLRTPFEEDTITNNNSNNKTRFKRGNETAEALITRN